ncbi:MAG: Asp-tRNA(Asn)/Glu-tRNA(Gln) amidotransferase GatCAB subunit C [Candidatus Nitrosothermus koennekii]|nr:MAG: Asp-tRNA(Asn)/Glu-tRNA(Gln) amidotransferase GatCAB subunit C [Candidatus Nitrosothermus koennekii]
MNIDKDKVKHLAWLARIELDDNELDIYVEQINKIIDYLNILDEAQAEDEPNYLIAEIDQLRDDIAIESKDDVFDVVINKKDGFVKAPKMS